MGRPSNDDLSVNWKIHLSAPVAGRVDYMLEDPVHRKPIYGARKKLLESLLEWWIARESGRPPEALPHVPTLMQLRDLGA